jgi:serine-type D-Ala-D-Ala endopeptidase (penicillin-binding protein 7)
MRTLAALLLAMAANLGHADVTARSWLVADASGTIIRDSHSQDVRPMASITKLITAMVVLDRAQSLDQKIPMSHHLWDALPKNHMLTRREALYLALVKSSNRAALTLCEQYPGGVSHCLAAMNAKFRELGMYHSHVNDATGLDKGNVSTARDLAKLVLAARDYPDIVRASQMPEVEIRTQVPTTKKRSQKSRGIREKILSFRNTNPLVRLGLDDVVVSKTGYTSLAGGCIALLMNDRVVIVLGSRDTRTRIPEAQHLSRISLGTQGPNGNK